eukprot:6818381-Prymnesium_polylepis.1
MLRALRHLGGKARQWNEVVLLVSAKGSCKVAIFSAASASDTPAWRVSNCEIPTSETCESERRSHTAVAIWPILGHQTT